MYGDVTVFKLAIFRISLRLPQVACAASISCRSDLTDLTTARYRSTYLCSSLEGRTLFSHVCWRLL